MNVDINHDVPLYVGIYEFYKNAIDNGTILKGEKLPTEKEMMDLFSVSRITVKNGVQILADEGYVVKIQGKGTFVKDDVVQSMLNLKSKEIIGLILCDIDYTFGMELLRSIEKEVRKKGYHLIFKRSDESRELEIDAINEMISLGVSGIIIQTVHGETYSDDILRVYLSGFPMVFIDRHMERTSIPFVSSDNEHAAVQLTKLLKKAKYKNISFVSADPKGTTTLERRYEGFKKEYSSNGKLDILNLETPLTRDKKQEDIVSDINNIVNHIRNNPEIDCFFAAELHVAKLTRKALSYLGKKVPEDVGIVSFDNDTANSKYSYYTHVKQNETLIGEKAFEILDSIINKRSRDSNQLFIKTEIFQGKSTKEII